MFANNKYISAYNQLLKELTDMGANFKSDSDKIKVISTINYLKYIANKIEPQASIDWYK